MQPWSPLLWFIHMVLAGLQLHPGSYTTWQIWHFLKKAFITEWDTSQINKLQNTLDLHTLQMRTELQCTTLFLHHHQQLVPRAPTSLSTFRLLGCCRTSMTCLRLSSRSRRLLYSSWLVSSVWCWSRISSQRIFWMVLRWRNSSSCMDSCWRSSMACSRSFCVCLLFNS